MKNYLRLLQYLKPYVWPYFVLAMVCMLGYSATEGAMPFLVQWMMDDVFVKKDVVMLYYLPPDDCRNLFYPGTAEFWPRLFE